MVGLFHREGMSTRLVSVIFCRGKWGSDKVGRFVIISDVLPHRSLSSSLLEAFFGRWREMPTELDQRNDGGRRKPACDSISFPGSLGPINFFHRKRGPQNFPRSRPPSLMGNFFFPFFGFCWLAESRLGSPYCNRTSKAKAKT